MTNTTIDPRELSARELDAALADRVMKWKRVRSDRDEGDDRKDVAWMRLKDRVLKGEPYTYPSMEGLYDRTFAKWHPSEDVAAAMEVIEKMRSGQWDVQMTSDDKSPAWHVSFDKRGEAGKLLLGEAESDSLPKAACRAALSAIQSESEVK